MPKKPRKRSKPATLTPSVVKRPAAGRPVNTPPVESDRITYRELRNTPGRVWERLAEGTPLTLVADGEAKALVIPLAGDDAAEMLSAYRRARALQSIRALQAESRRTGRDRMTLAEINAEIRAVRRERAAREAACS